MLTDGCEWVVDARGCDAARVADLATLEALFARIIDELCLTPIAQAVWHVFPAPGGVTGLVPLAESHLTIHTFPEHASLCINLFCCRARDEWPWAVRLHEHVGAVDIDVHRIERRYVDRPDSFRSELADILRRPLVPST